ncbi:MAG: histidinol-phosphate transaminase [Bacteroidaceae bacterium]|nr:histidinol-phosphate transaminase [Bacteroidaceae bacterium]
MKSLQELVRPNIWELEPYSSARDEYKGVDATVFLDANENPYNSPVNRYPDPLQWEVKEMLAPVKGVRPEQIFLGNGSDEAIDLIYRCFCVPGVDNVVAMSPTYGMYKVCADINDVEYRPVQVDQNFQISVEKMLAATDEKTKAIFLCSPNNPTGNRLNNKDVYTLIQQFQGIIVLDEAYIDFSSEPSFLAVLDKCPNLVVLQTFSKAWGCAGMRLGLAMADPKIIEIFNKVKYPYNVNLLTQEKAKEIITARFDVDRWIRMILEERGRLMASFATLPITKIVYPTDANFFLARMTDAPAIYNYLVGKGIIVRNRSKITLCDNCLRITIGTKAENTALLAALRNYPSK